MTQELQVNEVAEPEKNEERDIMSSSGSSFTSAIGTEGEAEH